MRYPHQRSRDNEIVTWILPPEVRGKLLEDGRSRFPEEACGLLFGTIRRGNGMIENYLPVTNTARSPLHTFELDPAEWVRSCYHPGFIGLYHTHPTALPCPSSEDMRALPYFAERIRLYLIGSPDIANKPTGEPDDSWLNAYSVELIHNGGYALRSAQLL